MREIDELGRPSSAVVTDTEIESGVEMKQSRPVTARADWTAKGAEKILRSLGSLSWV